MSVFVKPKLKALKECLGKKDWPGVEKNAEYATSDLIDQQRQFISLPSTVPCWISSLRTTTRKLIRLELIRWRSCQLTSTTHCSLRRVFLALAKFHLEKFDESEAGYKKAIELSPAQPLARQVSHRPIRSLGAVAARAS